MHPHPSRNGLLLLNVGTPDEPTVSAVRRYLREFLMDPYVVDIAWPLRWLLVHGLILPIRPRASVRAYAKIWGANGSPLLEHHKALAQAMRERLGAGWKVEAAMRYGTPTITSAFKSFESAGIRRITVLPMYPQYSLAATESALKATRKIAADLLSEAELMEIRSFYVDPGFISSYVRRIRESISDGVDHVLFSFHGLPERQVSRVSSSCFESETCCTKVSESNALCYRAQSFATARALARELALAPDKHSVAFQSRLGRTPWIRPFTDFQLLKLARAGVKSLAVVCPSFTADCLETLEEIGIRGRDEFLAAGGEKLTLVPALNSDPEWVSVLARMVTK